MSSSNQHQFRYTQTPSKVLHFRNLPWECSDEELADLCSPFGKIVNTKCNVGANRNQAFVEFVDLNQAISMVSYYAASSEPAQVRGKTVYIQYSNRHENVNSKGPGDVPGNVLLVTFDGVEAGEHQFRYTQTPSKVLHFRNLPWECSDEELADLCSPFGKIVNTKCNVGANRNQAFVEFVDLNQAISMVSYYAASSEPAQVRGKTVYIQYSNRHEIVNSKGPGDVPGNVLLVTFDGVEAGENGQTQALIQYPDVTIAASAKEALEGHNIYDGGYHKLHPTYSRHTDLNFKAFTAPSLTARPDLLVAQRTPINRGVARPRPRHAPGIQNTPPVTNHRGRTRGSPSRSILPSWYPRTPLRDITAVDSSD
ncbi:hypothetical protein RYX36_025432 [Vicia faba]